jgi:outer membrane protein OmpU
MKHTLLATTALVAMTGAAAAEITVSGTGRIGLRTTEGAAATNYVAAKAGSISKEAAVWYALYVAGAGTGGAAISTTNAAVAATTGVIVADQVKLATALAGAKADLLAAQVNYADLAALAATTTANLTTARGVITARQNDVDSLTEIKAAADGTQEVLAAAKGSDTTSAVNRFRISFAGSGETDSGISYGISGRAEQSDSSVAGSQYISGAFGKIKMGDLGGADKDAAGHIAGGVGLSGMGSSNEISYQASGHNLGYEFSTNGLTFGYSQDTAIQTGDNSAVGIKWAGDMGGAGLTVGVGQSKMGAKTQTTMSVAVSMSGLTIKGISSTNDNGPAVTVAAAAGLVGTRYTAGSTTANNDTDMTGFSISYAMDAMSITAYSKTVSTLGSADKDYSGLGFAYDMGGATLKAGMVDDDNVSSMDIGVSFSF